MSLLKERYEAKKCLNAAEMQRPGTCLPMGAITEIINKDGVKTPPIIVERENGLEGVAELFKESAKRKRPTVVAVGNGRTKAVQELIKTMATADENYGPKLIVIDSLSMVDPINQVDFKRLEESVEDLAKNLEEKIEPGARLRHRIIFNDFALQLCDTCKKDQKCIGFDSGKKCGSDFYRLCPNYISYIKFPKRTVSMMARVRKAEMKKKETWRKCLS